MPTAPSWTELRVAASDLGALLRMRTHGLSARSRRHVLVGLAVVVVLTVLIVGLAAWLPGGLERTRAGSIIAVIPSAMLAFLALTILAAGAAGGGREVLPRDEAVAFPISTTTDHLGAVLMAPLNIAWLLQSWTLLGMTAYGLGSNRLWATELVVVLWIVAATVAAQMAAWLLEGVRRARHGILVSRLGIGLVALVFVLLVVTHRLAPLLDRSPTRLVLFTATAAQTGSWTRWLVGVLILVVIIAVGLYLGAVAADWALGRAEHEELRLESRRHPPRPAPRAALWAMVRIDRAAIWRSVPLRRGILVLAVMPGAVALAGHLEWRMLTILPGLVVSGGALLFGVNSWCLDGRGALWRDSLPAAAGLAFWSRVVVLTEVLLVSAVLTAFIGAARAGRPAAAELTAVVCATVVVTVQVVSASMRWSVRNPYASDMRSARATPAPPVMMVGYSARLAWWTTLTGLVFSGLATQSDWLAPVLLSVPMLCWSSYRLVRTAGAWAEPEIRARVVAVVAA